MKYVLIILTALLLTTGCEEPVPEDIAGKKVLLKKMKEEMRMLKDEVGKLQAEIQLMDASPGAKNRKLVTMVKAATKDVDRKVEIQATVQSEDVAFASSETGGRLLEVAVKEGEFVEMGTLIARVDMESVQKQINEIQTTMTLAQDVYNRQKNLWDKKIGTEMDYLQAKNNKERLEKSLETIQHQLTKANVYAPISGVADQVMLQTGELAGPGMPIVQILNVDKVKVVAAVPEIYLKSVKRGAAVSIYFPALDVRRNGKVSLVGSSINPSNRTFNVEVNLSNNKKLFKPNLLAIMEISDYKKKDAIVVPMELIQQEVDGDEYVYIKGQGDNGLVAKKAYVEIGESTGEEVIILKGLNGDEDLIADGARGLVENELIEVN